MPREMVILNTQNSDCGRDMMADRPTKGGAPRAAFDDVDYRTRYRTGHDRR
jgi:hypothetical protein